MVHVCTCMYIDVHVLSLPTVLSPFLSVQYYGFYACTTEKMGMGLLMSGAIVMCIRMCILHTVCERAFR